MLKQMSTQDRLRLMKFVCSFAWADLEIKPEEKAFVHRLAKKLGLSPEEDAKVEGWLLVPPRPEEVDPALVPPAHRKLFYDTARKVIEADRDLDPSELEILDLFKQLLR